MRWSILFMYYPKVDEIVHVLERNHGWYGVGIDVDVAVVIRSHPDGR